MGKTKTAFISDLTDTKKTGKEAYEAKMKKKAAAMAAQGKDQVKGLGLKGGERIKVIGSDLPPVVDSTSLTTSTEDVSTESVTDEAATTTALSRVKKVRVRGKKYKAALVKFDKTKHYSLTDAIRLVKETSYSKFDGTVELHLVTKSEVNKQVELPFFTGKAKKVEIADDKTVEKIKAGKIDFDILLATADMMPKLVPFAKTLGPRGMMPNPKNGTLIKSAKDADKFSGSQITLKTQKDQNVMHVAIGKISQKDTELIKNVDTVFEAVDRKKIDKAYITPTMGPAVKIQI